MFCLFECTALRLCLSFTRRILRMGKPRLSRMREAFGTTCVYWENGTCAVGGGVTFPNTEPVACSHEILVSLDLRAIYPQLRHYQVTSGPAQSIPGHLQRAVPPHLSMGPADVGDGAAQSCMSLPYSSTTRQSHCFSWPHLPTGYKDSHRYSAFRVVFRQPR